MQAMDFCAPHELDLYERDPNDAVVICLSGWKLPKGKTARFIKVEAMVRDHISEVVLELEHEGKVVFVLARKISWKLDQLSLRWKQEIFYQLEAEQVTTLETIAVVLREHLRGRLRVA